MEEIKVYAVMNPGNEEFNKYYNVYVSCFKAGEEILPPATAKFFGTKYVKDIEIDKKRITLPYEFNGEEIVIEIKKIPMNYDTLEIIIPKIKECEEKTKEFKK